MFFVFAVAAFLLRLTEGRASQRPGSEQISPCHRDLVCSLPSAARADQR